MKKLITLYFLVLSASLFAQSNYKTEIDAWHNKRIESLKQPNGWLNLEGLFWLHEGVNTFGSAKGSDCFYDNATFPKYLGDFIWRGDSIVWKNQPASLVSIDNKVVSPNQETKVFSINQPFEKPKVFSLDHFTWTIIKREEKVGIRFRNLNAKTLLDFKGIERFTVDSQYRVPARFVAPVENLIMITNVLGQTTAQKKAGTIYFTIRGNEYHLDVIDEGGSTYFITFADATSGKSTYGAGRFIDINKPDAQGNTFIDFNKAYNPPCAFTAFATCPLPPEQNRLTIAIEAGEKKFGHH
jgi:uncharacterized protein (DUF1684 family)